MEPSDNSQAVNNNQMSNQTSEVTLVLVLPRDASKDGKKKPVKTRLDVLVQDLVKRIIEEHGFKYIILICKGTVLSPDKRLDEQGVKNHSKIMVVKVTEQGVKNHSTIVEMKVTDRGVKNHSTVIVMKVTDELKLQMLERTQTGLRILCGRDGIKDPWAPFLEIADQWGNSLTIPDKERKALILALGFHEKGRSLMKRKDYDYAACHLEMADEEFRRLDPSIRTAVDNFPVLQLDIVWCQRADLKDLKDPSSLNDARSRLQTAEECFLGCYGKEYERLRMIKGDAGIEKAQVLLLRFYLLQSLLFYLENNYCEAQAKLTKVESLYGRLVPDNVPVFPRFSSSEEPSTSFNSVKEDDIVSDVLKDISRHEEDYLDPTLEEEREFINEMKTYLNVTQ